MTSFLTYVLPSLHSGSGSGRHRRPAAFNSVILIDRHGEIVLVYDKVHVCVWLAPSSMLQPGTDFFVAQVRKSIAERMSYPLGIPAKTL